MGLLFLMRHGETYLNLRGVVGGDSSLTEKGRAQVAGNTEKILTYLSENEVRSPSSGLGKVFHSAKKRTRESAKIIKSILLGANMSPKVFETDKLDELYAGDYDSLTYNEIESKYKDFFEKRKENKFETNYPNGESYKTVLLRISSFVDDILEQLKKDNTIIVGHQAVNRIILGLLLKIDENSMTRLKISQDCVFCLEFNDKSDIVNVNTIECQGIKNFVYNKK